LAVIPDIVKNFDLAGTCLGFVKKGDIITGQDIDVGDLIIGLKSSGLHSNGYTLARKIFESKGFSYNDLLPGTEKTIGDILLEPTIIYSPIVLEILKRFEIKGMANITGSGLRNLIRLKENVEFTITDGFEPQHIFKVIQELGAVSTEEMYQTFNMGMGFSLIVDENAVDEVLQFIKNDVEAKIVGEVKKGKGVSYPELNIKYERY
jgi:phosphoribosylformylglycinamidine cyclo-ligase